MQSLQFNSGTVGTRHVTRVIRLIAIALCTFCAGSLAGAEQEPAPDSLAFIDAQIAAHPGDSGAYLLDSGEESLIARAWLADHAAHTIDVQYFIWSTDNIGILAAEALLRAADRGVQVRIIVDDLLMDAAPESLLALAKHPNIDIRIYNPKVSVGVPLYARVWNTLTDFRDLNQRMHDKTFVVDGKVVITGGRNMAAEYYDYHHEYNFRDRDALIVGAAAQDVRASFERFWKSGIAVPVESLYDGSGHVHEEISDARVRAVYRELHAYANSPENFAPQVRTAIEFANSAFERLARQTEWGRVDFICDEPGKNDSAGLNGGGRTTRSLGELISKAHDHIVIQSPYLVMSDPAFELFRQTRARGVRVRINTNSLASTDNLQAFAGYRNQRERLLAMGLQVFEFRPDAASAFEARRRELVQALPAAANPATKFGLHAKTMVLDSKVVFVGTFNLDPRSANLNTEVGVVIHNEHLARAVEAAIETDMRAGNSWNAATDDPDQFATFGKRSKVRFWQLLPIQPLL